MDPSTLGGWIGGILGAAVGVLGGVIGTYFSIRNTNGRRERAFAIKASIVGWVLVLAFAAGMLLIPGWYKHLLWIPYVVLLVFGIRWWNKTQFRIRQEETGQVA